MDRFQWGAWWKKTYRVTPIADPSPLAGQIDVSDTEQVGQANILVKFPSNGGWLEPVAEANSNC